MAQNIYDDQEFFKEYAKTNRSVLGLDGTPEWHSIQSMLPNLGGLSILDLGCGYGWFCREARRKGAKRVVGVDISEKMLSKAREMTEDDSAITYQQEDLERVTLPENMYDLVYSSVVLHYIENLSSLIRTVYHSLKPGGYFIFFVEHPIRTAPLQPGWIVDKENGQQSWPVNNYQLEGPRVIRWLTDGVVKQHRTMSTYINLLIKAEFAIKYVEEWSPTLEQIEKDPELAVDRERPRFLLVSAQKPDKK